MKNFLVLTGPGFGDIVARMVLLRNIKKYLGGKVFAYNTESYAGGIPILKKLNYVDEILSVNENDKISLFKFIIKNHKKFDYIIDPCLSTNKKAIFTWLLGCKEFSIGFDTCKLSFLYNKKIKYNKERIVSAEAGILSNVFGVSISKDDLCLDFPKELIKKTEKVAKVINKFDRRITIFVGYNFRSLSVEKWQAIINGIRRKYSCWGIFLVGREECMWADLKNLDEDFRKKLSLEELAFLIKKSDVFITANGGPMWISAGLRTKTIAIHGPSKFVWEPEMSNVINLRPYKYPDCQPCEGKCYLSSNRKFECLKVISVKEVLDQIDKLTKSNFKSKL